MSYGVLHAKPQQQSKMGGNLFKLGRLPKAEYLKVESELRHYLDQKLGDLYRIPRYYRDKPDFGDVDIIVSDAAIQSTWQDLRLELIKDLGIQQHKSLGSVFSTVYQNFQADFFYREHRYFESTYNYLSFNDVGNILGKIFKRFNLKYGEQGLLYVFRRADGHFQKTWRFLRILNAFLLFYNWIMPTGCGASIPWMSCSAGRRLAPIFPSIPIRSRIPRPLKE